MTTNTKERTSLVNKFLNGVEKAGNKLPDPAMLFFLMCVGLAVISETSREWRNHTYKEYS